MRTGKPSNRSSGSAYLFLLLLLSSLTMAASQGVRLGEASRRFEGERALIQIGMTYQRALKSYARHGGGHPPNLNDLLRDPRTPGIVRHLRRLQPDPLCGCPWGVLRNEGGGIVAVFSQARGTPLRQSGWEPELAHFDDARSYADWEFGFRRRP